MQSKNVCRTPIPICNLWLFIWIVFKVIFALKAFLCACAITTFLSFINSAHYRGDKFYIIMLQPVIGLIRDYVWNRMGIHPFTSIELAQCSWSVLQCNSDNFEINIKRCLESVSSCFHKKRFLFNTYFFNKLFTRLSMYYKEKVISERSITLFHKGIHYKLHFLIVEHSIYPSLSRKIILLRVMT